MKGRVDTAAKIVAMRKHREWTQEELAATLGVGWKHIGQLENGRRAISPSMARLLTYVDRFGPLEDKDAKDKI